jgi:light-regulated signal transduction histidine kinase (bacteriophytochrome)
MEAFTYSISHDLRAPLRHIAGFSQRLFKDFGSNMAPEAREYLQLIENGTRHMNLMISGLLDLAQLGQHSLQRSLTELNPIVDRVILLLRPEYDGRDVEWRIARLPAIECDPVLIGQVFQNLLSNALKYSGRRPKAVIEIDSIRQEGKPPVIFVRDNGAGFDMHHATTLFGVFQRMHTEAEFEGIGVGLSTVHRIVQIHGGSIWAEAEPGQGATFYFTVGVQAPTGNTATGNRTRELEHQIRG